MGDLTVEKIARSRDHVEENDVLQSLGLLEMAAVTNAIIRILENADVQMVMADAMPKIEETGTLRDLFRYISEIPKSAKQL